MNFFTIIQTDIPHANIVNLADMYIQSIGINDFVIPILRFTESILPNLTAFATEIQHRDFLSLISTLSKNVPDDIYPEYFKQEYIILDLLLDNNISE